MKYFITNWEKEKGMFLQERAEEKMLKFGLGFVVLYFGSHLVVAFIRLIF